MTIGNWKPQIHRDAKYLQFVREQECLICHISPCDPHHVNQKGISSGGMSLKISDYRTIPLCRLHHSESHSIGHASMQEKHGIDYREQIINMLEKYIHQHCKFQKRIIE